MAAENFTLTGSHIRLEPLQVGHLAGLISAAVQDPSLYRLSAVPQTREECSDLRSAVVAHGTILFEFAHCFEP